MKNENQDPSTSAGIWSKIASLYEARFMNLRIYDESYKCFCRQFPVKNPRILELGCGPGNITAFLFQQLPEASILCTDYAANMLAIAEKNNPKAEFMLLDARQIRAIHTVFEGIAIGFCIPYLSPSECRQLFHGCACLMEENGLLYLSFVPGESSASSFQINGNGDSLYFHYHPEEDVKAWLAAAGFLLSGTFEIQYEKPGSVALHLAFVAVKSQTQERRLNERSNAKE